MAIVERGKAEAIVEKAKKAGALGATILYGRGTGHHEMRKLLNIHIESSKELIVIIVKEDVFRPIYDAVVEAGNLHELGKGIIFTIQVGNVLGLNQNLNNM